MKQRGGDKHIATIVTQVVVDKNDEGFQNPTKSIRLFILKKEQNNCFSRKRIL